jgi:two-component system, OmpR family, phosphate regulon sensor histidine kinase PhoR
MNLHVHRQLIGQEIDYERVTRQIRWFAIAATFVTLPPNQPQSLPLYGLMALAAIFNLSRYVPAFMKVKFFASRITMLIVDNLFVAALLFVVSTPGTPYTGLLVLMIITATYWYGLRGMLSVIAGQTIFLVALSANHFYPELVIDSYRMAALSVLVLLAIGLLTERLTHVERHERSVLQHLSDENQTERDRLFALVNSLNDAIAVVDARGRVMQANGAVQELARTQKDLRGRDISRLLPLRHRTHGKISLLEIIKSSPDPQRRRDLTMAGDDGADLDLDITITPVELGAQKSINYIIVCRDITKEKSLDVQREEFISVASHELRTPLTIIEAALSTSLLSKDKMPAPVATMIEQAHRNTVFLAGLVRDLTTLSQAQNDSIPIELRPVDAHMLLNQLIRDFKSQADEKGLALKAVIMPGTPTVLSTEHHVHEILQNYIANAVKYTEEGGVTVKAEPGRNGGVLFAVQDTGIGISAADQRHLFTKFYRSEDFRTRETGGTGLGLYLCLELAERLNARVWCKSTLNHGSIFYLEVPPFSKLQRDHGKVVEAEVSSLIDQL